MGISLRQIVITVIIIVVALVVGFSLGRYSISPQKTVPPPKQEAKVSSPLFQSQTATFQGEITKIEDSKLSAKDEKGQTGSFPISSKVVIYKFKKGSNQASASSDLKTVEEGKQALVVLELIDQKYQVISISYLPPPPKK